MAIKTYNCTAITGGGVRALDALLVANLNDGDRAHVITADGFYVYEYDSTGTAAEVSPDVIRPDDYATAGNWINQNSPFGTQQPDTATVGPFGNIFGGDITKTGANELTVSAFSCLDKTLKVKLNKATATVVTIPAVANTIYHLAAVRLVSTGAITVQAYLSEAAIAADATISAYRWIGFAITSGASAVIDMPTTGDIATLKNPANLTIATGIGTTYTAVDPSATLPIGRVETITYGGTISTTATTQISLDGGSSINTGVGMAAVEPNASIGQFPASIVPQFKTTAGTVNITVRAIKMRR